VISSPYTRAPLLRVPPQNCPFNECDLLLAGIPVEAAGWQPLTGRGGRDASAREQAKSFNLAANPTRSIPRPQCNIRRQFDEVGTAGLLNWFGPVLEPVIGLAEAIILGLLVSYDYRLHTVTLDSAELGAYKELTERIKLITAIAASLKARFLRT